MKIITFLFLVFSTCSAFAQQCCDSCSTYFLKEEEYRDSLDIYREQYKGKVMNVPEKFELALYCALRCYPDLEYGTIEIKHQRMPTSMEARPESSSIFRKKSKRTYVIAINNRKGKFKGVDWDQVSFNIMVGWFAHELGHLQQYNERSGLSLAWMGTRFVLSGKYRKKTEQDADQRAISHSLGYCLYDSKCYLHYTADIDEHYRSLASKYYLSPEKVLDAINTYRLSHLSKAR